MAALTMIKMFVNLVLIFLLINIAFAFRARYEVVNNDSKHGEPLRPNHRDGLYSDQGVFYMESKFDSKPVDWVLNLKSHSQHQNTDDTKLLKKGNRITMKQKEMGNKNLMNRNKAKKGQLKDGEIITYNPGDKAPGFTLFTLDGELSFPSQLFTLTNIMFHVYDPDSGFRDALWNSPEALTAPLVNLPNNSHIIFLSAVRPSSGLQTALWMKQQVLQGLERQRVYGKDLLSRLHFGVNPVNALGNWLSTVLKEWMCVDHNCGYDQIVVQSPDITGDLVMMRLDARYDWLPSPGVVFPNKTVLRLVESGDGCLPSPASNGSVAYVTDAGCSYFTKVAAMEKSGAVAVLIKADSPGSLKDMNCEGEECSQPLNIPSSMIPATPSLIGDRSKTVYYQNTPSDNFHLAIDTEGRLVESGWWLYPSFKFLIWEAQWLNYKAGLRIRLDEAGMVVPIFKSQVMQGQTGVVANITLPPMEKMRLYGRVELDMALSCPGSRDTTCAHWDHTIQLFICCAGQPPQFCEMEIGRWISPFRRRVGRWLTDITPLLPLLNGTCTFTMKTAPWAMPWIPSLNIRFSEIPSAELFPSSVLPLYYPGATFDKNYNSHFPHIQFIPPVGTHKVFLYSVITGHGSDNNGCGEFCVTSHHIKVNNVTSNITFSNAGSPEGCADRVPEGVIPNEHGTWLYGRDGWCDGQQVNPWVVDVTDHVTNISMNSLQYYGLFNGTDPNPKENPGVIILWSYLVYYKQVA